MRNYVELLKCNVNKNMRLAEILQAFIKLSEYDLCDVSFLFETGIFTFTCDEEFLFSLVAQYKHTASDDKYYNIRLDVVYPPTLANSDFSSHIWFDDSKAFLKYVLKSEEYALLSNEYVYKIDIYEDEA